MVDENGSGPGTNAGPLRETTTREGAARDRLYMSGVRIRRIADGLARFDQTLEHIVPSPIAYLRHEANVLCQMATDGCLSELERDHVCGLHAGHEGEHTPTGDDPIMWVDSGEIVGWLTDVMEGGQ